jgi:protein-tyrosine phosphatase
MEKIGVMFVCLGNICRSPMAEAIFRDLVQKRGLVNRFEIASAGTDNWHVGEPPHRGTQQILARHKIEMGKKRAQQLTARDLDFYDYVVVMDASNAAEVEAVFGKKLKRLLEFAPPGSPLDVPDPYYENNFNEVYQLVLDGCEGLLQHIREQEGL